MKKLLQVLLPPFVGFAVYFLMVRYSSFYFSLRIDEMGQGNLLAFMAFYRYLLPLLFTVSVLTQLLIVIPVYRKVMKKGGAGKKWAAVFLVFVCLLFAAGISYAIWDKNDGIHHLLKLFTFMTGIQLGYWAINLFILRLLGWKSVEIKKIEDPKQPNATNL
ncbi:MAG TPA: hypothetical protein DCO83_10825 [Mucilaginibacter sp.]|jgi:hypothetical protein|nr:hypothetical protein [Mucilaginibacter sp.]